MQAQIFFFSRCVLMCTLFMFLQQSLFQSLLFGDCKQSDLGFLVAIYLFIMLGFFFFIAILIDKCLSIQTDIQNMCNSLLCYVYMCVAFNLSIKHQCIVLLQSTWNSCTSLVFSVISVRNKTVYSLPLLKTRTLIGQLLDVGNCFYFYVLKQ